MNPFWLFLVAGVSLLAVEMLVFQFTTFWLFFIGLGALVAAAFAWVAADASFLTTTFVFVVASVIITAVLFAPLRKWQKQPSGISGNNAVGQKVTVKGNISKDAPGVVMWSGSDWQAELAEGEHEEIAIGATARVVRVEGIRLIVASA